MSETTIPSDIVLDERTNIADVYIALMQQVVIRLDAVALSLAEAKSNPDHVNNWQNAEFCYLQIRKVCEYVALAVLAAHGEYDGAKASNLEKEWHAAELFDKIAQLNPYSFPIPIQIQHDQNGVGRHHLAPGIVKIQLSEISGIYGSAGARLHVGSLRNLLSGRLPPYDLAEVADWRNRFVQTLNIHSIRLPHVACILLVHLKDERDGQVHCAFAEAEGPFVIEGDATVFPTVFNVDQVH